MNSILCILSLFSNLQEGVPDTIANLRLAGMVVWVLTGDKQETAINIAYSCKLFTEKMEIIKLNAHSRDSAEQILNKNLEDIKYFNENIDESQHNESDNQGKKVQKLASLTVQSHLKFGYSEATKFEKNLPIKILWPQNIRTLKMRLDSQ